jgi:hypothetical protein
MAELAASFPPGKLWPLTAYTAQLKKDMVAVRKPADCFYG